VFQVEGIGGQHGHAVAFAHQSLANFDKIARCAAWHGAIHLNDMQDVHQG
jgi:hypothetical protein